MSEERTFEGKVSAMGQVIADLMPGLECVVVVVDERRGMIGCAGTVSEDKVVAVLETQLRLLREPELGREAMS